MPWAHRGVRRGPTGTLSGLARPRAGARPQGHDARRSFHLPPRTASRPDAFFWLGAGFSLKFALWQAAHGHGGRVRQVHRNPFRQSEVDTAEVPTEPLRTAGIPAWVDGVFRGLVAYAALATVWMLTGFGGPEVTRYVGLLSDAPAAFVTVILLATTVRFSVRGAAR